MDAIGSNFDIKDACMIKNIRYISVKEIGKFIILFIAVQLCIWYGGLADLIPIGLLNYWNMIQIGITVGAGFFCILKRRISSITAVLILYKATLLFSTILNGREVDIVEFSRYFGLIFLIELFAKDTDVLINIMMLIFEVMIYYNLFTCIQNGPDLFGAYYGALGYDNGFPPYLLAAYFVAYNYHCKKGTWFRTVALIGATHLTAFITFSATGIVGIIVVDILLVLNHFVKMKVSLFQSYLILLGFQLAIVFFRIQNVFSFIIVNLLGKDLTFTGRTKDWDMALELIPSKIFFGHGMMDQSTEKSILGDVFCHNGVLEQLFRGGIIYFLTFAVAIFLISKALKRTNNLIIQNNILIICGYWVLSMTEVVLEGTMLCGMLALLFAIGKSEKKNKWTVQRKEGR